MSLTEEIYTDQKLDEIILKKDGVRPEGVFLAEMCTSSSLTNVTNDSQKSKIAGEIVGTTTGYFNKDGNSGTIHMVSVLDKAQGMGLGKILCQHAMHYLIINGCKEIVLTTDDHRLPAIKTYLNLGYVPVISGLHTGQPIDEDMIKRWKDVYSKLNLQWKELLI